MIIQRKPYQPRQDMARAESAEETPMTNYYSKPLAKENEKADPNSPAAISDWERKLLNPPSYQETTALINAYQSGQMTDENFYNLVDKMLSSDSEEARIYAIMALQGTPSVPSFERLAKLLASENNQVLVVRIQESLKTYHASQHLHVLTLSLQSDEVHARTQAAVLIQESAKINLKPEQVANSGESPRLIRGAATNVQNVGGNNPPTAFRQAQRALQSALAIEPDANTKNLIKNSLDYLNQMMGPLSQIAATPTT